MNASLNALFFVDTIFIDIEVLTSTKKRERQNLKILTSTEYCFMQIVCVVDWYFLEARSAQLNVGM